MHTLTFALEHYATPIVLTYKSSETAGQAYERAHSAYKRARLRCETVEDLELVDEYGQVAVIDPREIVVMVNNDVQQSLALAVEREKMRNRAQDEVKKPSLTRAPAIDFGGKGMN